MEQDFGSECSSGCESGWTLYFEQSMYSSHFIQNHNNVNDFSCKKSSFAYEDDEEEEEEEDMSMVSDASSGPPHFQQQHECFNNNNNNMNNKNVMKRQKIPKDVNLHSKIQDLPSFLDDTASSPFFNFSNNNLTVPTKNASMEENDIIEYSQGGYSTTYFEGKSTFQHHFGFFHPSVSGTQLQQNQWFEGKR